MTHEPIRVIHFSPHITWQGTQAELDAMLAEGWPMGSASEVIAACKRDAAEAEAYAAELEAKLAKALLFVYDFAHRARADEHDNDEMFLLDLSNIRFERDCDITQARTILAELKGQK